MGPEGLQLCLAFLLGASVGYSVRATISSVRRAKVRQRRQEELALLYACEHSTALDRQLVADEQATQSLTASPALAGSCSDNPRD